MKYILKSPIIISCYIIVIILGFLIGNDISNNFLELYLAKMSSVPARYILLSFAIFIHYIVYNHLNVYGLFLREKNFLNFSFYIIKVEFVILTTLFIMLHIPILIMEYNHFIENIFLIVKIIFNDIIFSLAFISIIRMIDTKLRNRSTSCFSVFIIFAVIDFILEYFNYVTDNYLFDFSYILILPSLYKNYFIIFLLVLSFIVYSTVKSLDLMMKNDYFLDENYEKS